jgi:hypothetical protein
MVSLTDFLLQIRKENLSVIEIDNDQMLVILQNLAQKDNQALLALQHFQGGQSSLILVDAADL